MDLLGHDATRRDLADGIYPTGKRQATYLPRSSICRERSPSRLGLVRFENLWTDWCWHCVLCFLPKSFRYRAVGCGASQRFLLVDGKSAIRRHVRLVERCGFRFVVCAATCAVNELWGCGHLLRRDLLAKDTVLLRPNATISSGHAKAGTHSSPRARRITVSKKDQSSAQKINPGSIYAQEFRRA